jgi:hypothetical protein
VTTDLVFHGRVRPLEGACLLKTLEAARKTLAEEKRKASSADDDMDSSAEELGDSTGQPAAAEEGHSSAEEFGLTFEERQAEAFVFVFELALSHGFSATERYAPYHIVLNVDASSLANNQAAGLCELAHGPQLSVESARRIGCDATMIQVAHAPDGSVLDVGRRTRKISSRLWLALVLRDRHCVFPGCGRSAYLKAHHIVHWCEGGETNLANLCLVCSRHHHLAHEGGFMIKGQAPHNLTFLSPEGVPLKPVTSRTLKADAVSVLKEQHQDMGLSITHETNQMLYYDPQLELNWAVKALQQIDHPEQQGAAIRDSWTV